VVEAGSVVAARTALSRPTVDVVILDLGLPGENGLRLLEELRDPDAPPVIVVSGYADVEDRISGLRLGAADYLAKPYSPSELAARVDAVLRRGRATGPSPRLSFDDGLVVDLAAREVTRDGREIVLRPREFDVLATFVSNPRRVFSRQELLRTAWKSSSEWQSAATVTEHVRKLRIALGDGHVGPGHITTVRGVGYRWDP